MRPPRITVRTLLVAVAVVALLIPFPLLALVRSIGVFAVGFYLPNLIIWEANGNRRAALVATVGIVAIGSLFLLRALGGWHLSHMTFLSWLICLLTPINLAGPFLTVSRYRRDGRLLSGEMLWTWMGLVWVVMLTALKHRDMHGYRNNLLELLVELARLTAVLALLLAVYGKRPTRPDPAWPHRIGWAVAECDVIAWGWYSVD